MFFIQPINKTLLSLGISTLMLTSPVIAQEQIVKTITVTGQGIESIPTTIATVQMGVEIEGQNPAQIQQEVAQRTTALLEILRSNNVEKLQTTGIQLRPNYRYDDNRRQLVNYTATNLVSFETSIDQVGTILDETVNVGATRIDSVSFYRHRKRHQSSPKSSIAKSHR